MLQRAARPICALGVAAVAAVSTNDGSSPSAVLPVPLLQQQPAAPVSLPQVVASPAPALPAASPAVRSDRGGPLAQAAIGGLVTVLFEAFGGEARRRITFPLAK